VQLLVFGVIKQKVVLALLELSNLLVEATFTCELTDDPDEGLLDSLTSLRI
jgi:hypothetical protein